MTPITLQLIKKPAIYGMILLFSRLPLVQRSEIKALDKPSLRCDDTNGNQSFSKCVGQFLEKNLNCSLRTLMSDPNEETCNAEKLNLTQKNIRDAYNDSTHVFNRINMIERREIFEMRRG